MSNETFKLSNQQSTGQASVLQCSPGLMGKIIGRFFFLLESVSSIFWAPKPPRLESTHFLVPPSILRCFGEKWVKHLDSWVVSFRILISEIPKSSVSDGIHGSFIAPGYHVAGTLLFVNSVAVERFNSGASKQLVSQNGGQMWLWKPPSVGMAIEATVSRCFQ